MQPKTEYALFGQHSVFDKNDKIGDRELPFREESAGSNVLFAIGGFILKKLENGGILFNNPKNTQLICAAREVPYRIKICSEWIRH